MVFFAVIVLFMIPLFANATHDPTGKRTNSGTIIPGDAYTFAVVEGADPNVWSYSVNEWSGAMDVKGHSTVFLTTYVLDYYCMIKISPSDATHKYLELNIDANFHYGMSAGWFSAASWQLYYCVFDMGQSTVRPVGWTKWSKTVSVSWGGQLNYQHYYTPDTYYDLYSDFDRWNHLYTFSNTQWYYVGIWLRLSVTGSGDIYKTAYASGYADWNVNSISWRFFE